MANALLVSDDPELLQSVSDVLQGLDCGIFPASSLQQGFHALNDRSDIHLVLLALNLASDKYCEAIRSLLRFPCRPQIIIITAQGDPDTAAQVIEHGAWDYIERPFSIPELRLILKRALLHRKEQSNPASLSRLQREGLIGSSPAFLSCLESLSKAASSKSNMLLSGETGTGKELFAKVIHKVSPWASSPFVTVDCASLPDNLVESLLHGHTKGSFTGADTSRTGLVKQADGGTLFLDEIGELSMSIQKSFLRILQERTIRPLGSPREEKSNFRLIAASNRDIREMVLRGEFRQDLYYRLCTNLITLPPLRNRKEDIVPLTQKFLARAWQEYNIEEKVCTKDFINALQQYDWPGNVRELINVIYSSVDSALYAPNLFPQHLPMDVRAKVIKNSLHHQRLTQDGSLAETEVEAWNNGHLISHQSKGNLPSLKEARNEAMNQAEVNYLRKVIRASKGNVSQACRIANISRPRFYELLKKHSINHRQEH